MSGFGGSSGISYVPSPSPRSIGSGGGSGGGGGGGGGKAPYDCDSITIRVVLNSPVPEIIKLITVGNHLLVELRDQSGRSFIAAIFGDQIAGAIIVPNQAILLECLKSGHKYHAVVVSITGGSCVIEIRSGGIKWLT